MADTVDKIRVECNTDDGTLNIFFGKSQFVIEPVDALKLSTVLIEKTLILEYL